MSRVCLLGLVAAVVCLSAGWASGAVLVSENFDSMGSASGMSSAPAGWTVGYLGTVGTQNRLAMSPYAGNGQAITGMPIYSLANTGVDYRTNYNGGTMSDVGHVYNCGGVGAADRALGNYARTNPSGDHIMQVAFSNNTGAPLSSIQLEYDMEEWGWGQGTSSSGLEMIRVLLSSTSDTTGFNYMGAAFDGVAPKQGAGTYPVIDGNLSANKVHVSGTYTLPSTLAPGAGMWLRFHDWNDNGTADHLLAIDNVLVTPEPATMGLLLLGGLALRRRR
jgi:hypothetical protein